jgi:ABC-type arginine/histidine transport system permease subunit
MSLALLALSFLLGAVLTLALTLRQVRREVPVDEAGTAEPEG